MLAKKYRLPASFFRKKPAHGSTVQLALFRVHVHPSSLPHSRFACAVSNQVFSSIVKRNAFRRAVYDAIRISKLFEIPGLDVVIRVHRGIALPGASEIRADMQKLSVKLKFQNKK